MTFHIARFDGLDLHIARFDGLDLSDYAHKDIPRETEPEHLTLEDFVRDNTRRAQWSLLGLDAYAKRCGTFTGESTKTIIEDFLGDLRHLCDALNLDFDDVDHVGYLRYTEEKAGVI